MNERELIEVGIDRIKRDAGSKFLKKYPITSELKSIETLMSRNDYRNAMVQLIDLAFSVGWSKSTEATFY